MVTSPFLLENKEGTVSYEDMKKILLILLFILPVTASEWKMVWNDEFNKNGAPDPKKWTYEEGFIRNQEDQYYTKNRRLNARVEKGVLIIEAHKEKYKNKQFTSKTAPEWQKNRPHAEYTSACLVTQGISAWKYGKVEIKAKLPIKKGAWPAFWMMGTDIPKVDWPRCGEIDIMEHVTSHPGMVHGTVHWPASAEETRAQNKGEKIKAENLDDWHTYTMEWDEKMISFSFDGKKYGEVSLNQMNGSVPEGMGDERNPFKKPFYLLINLAVGGAWGGPPDPNVFPQQLVLDYVRIYQKVEKK